MLENIPIDNQDDFREKLGSEILIEHSRLHFSGSTDTKEFPILLDFFGKE